jgi:hypothetical protein
MNKPFFFTSLSCVFLAGIVFLSGCSTSSQSQRPIGRIEETEDPRLMSWGILDYQNKDREGVFPAWVSLYLTGGNRAVEELWAYQDYYVFVSQNTGTNFSALEQWQAAFSADLDFARLAAVRI